MPSSNLYNYNFLKIDTPNENIDMLFNLEQILQSSKQILGI